MTDYAQNPAKFTIEWAGKHDRGYFKRYDKESSDDVAIKSIDFAVIQEAHSVSGHSKKFGSCFSNECIEHSEEKHLQIFKDKKPEVVMKGLWKEIKYESEGKYGGKFTGVLYACLLASSDPAMNPGDIVRILVRGCSLGPWIGYKDKKGAIACNSSELKTIGDPEDPDSVKFRCPIFGKSDAKTDFNFSSLRSEVIEFLKKKRLELMISIGQSESLPNSSPVEDETTPDEDEPPF